MGVEVPIIFWVSAKFTAFSPDISRNSGIAQQGPPLVDVEKLAVAGGFPEFTIPSAGFPDRLPRYGLGSHFRVEEFIPQFSLCVFEGPAVDPFGALAPEGKCGCRDRG